MSWIWAGVEIPSLNKLLSKKEAIREEIGLLIGFNNTVWLWKGRKKTQYEFDACFNLGKQELINRSLLASSIGPQIVVEIYFLLVSSCVRLFMC